MTNLAHALEDFAVLPWISYPSRREHEQPCP